MKIRFLLLFMFGFGLVLVPACKKKKSKKRLGAPLEAPKEEITPPVIEPGEESPDNGEGGSSGNGAESVVPVAVDWGEGQSGDEQDYWAEGHPGESCNEAGHKERSCDYRYHKEDCIDYNVTGKTAAPTYYSGDGSVVKGAFSEGGFRFPGLPGFDFGGKGAGYSGDEGTYPVGFKSGKGIFSKFESFGKFKKFPKVNPFCKFPMPWCKGGSGYGDTGPAPTPTPTSYDDTNGGKGY